MLFLLFLFLTGHAALIPFIPDCPTHMYTSRMAFANRANPTLLLPYTHSDHEIYHQGPIINKFVTQFPSEVEQDWYSVETSWSEVAQRVYKDCVQTKMAHLQPFLMQPDAASQKILDWIAHLPKDEHFSYLENPETYKETVNVCDCLKGFTSYAKLFSCVLVMAAINRKPSSEPAPSHWHDLDKKIFQHTQHSGTIITPYYQEKLNYISILLDQYARSTIIVPKIIFEKTYTLTPLCHLLALAQKVVPLPLPGTADAYDGEHAAETILNHTIQTLATYLLAEFVNGCAPAPSTPFNPFSQGNGPAAFVLSIAFDIISSQMSESMKNDCVFSAQSAHYFLDLAFKKKFNCASFGAHEDHTFEGISLAVSPENVAPLKILIAYTRLLTPFPPLEGVAHLIAFSERSDLRANFIRLYPAHNADHVHEPFDCIPHVSQSTNFHFQYPSDWWSDKHILEVGPGGITVILRKVYDFFIQNVLPKFIKENESVNIRFNKPNVPNETVVLCSTSRSPILIVMPSGPNHLTVFFPSKASMKSVSSCIQCHILLHSLLNGFDYAQDRIETDNSFPTAPLLSTISCVIAAKDKCPPYQANLENDPSLQRPSHVCMAIQQEAHNDRPRRRTTPKPKSTHNSFFHHYFWGD